MQLIRTLILVSGLLLSLVGPAQIRSVEGFEIPRLSPRPVSVAGVQQSQILLNGEWDFRIIGYKVQRKIRAPGEWEMQGFTVSEGETAVYSRNLDIPADWKNKRIKIRFDAVSSHAIVKLNGIRLGEHEGSFVPFEVDLSSAVSEEKNKLEVEVQSLTVSDRLACTSQYVVHTVGGILRKVTLFVLPEINIADITADPVFDKSYKDAAVAIRVSLANESTSLLSTSLRFTIKGANVKTVIQKSAKVNDQQSIANLQIRQPKQWNPEHPYLYQFQTELLLGNKVLQTVSRQIGFRQIKLKGNQVLVNGKPVKLHGVNRHSIYPLTGRSVSPELDRKDAELFGAANCNYIRTSHYPPSEEFLNACDELGLFVESDASLCWVNDRPSSPIWGAWNLLDEKFLPFMVMANVENILEGKAHPSVIIWSLANESLWSPLWVKVNSVVKQLDPARPTSFHDQSWGSYNNAGRKADIVNYHYPNINGPVVTDTFSRPTLFGEYAHLPTHNRRELLTDPGVRSAYGAPLVQFYDSIYAHKGNLGDAIWSGIDDVFHIPDGRIIGYGSWGPVDAWRRTKPEYWGMKKAYSPVRITNIDWSTLNEGYLELTVENRYDFTSFKEVKIQATVKAQNKC